MTPRARKTLRGCPVENRRRQSIEPTHKKRRILLRRIIVVRRAGEWLKWDVGQSVERASYGFVIDHASIGQGDAYAGAGGVHSMLPFAALKKHFGSYQLER